MGLFGRSIVIVFLSLCSLAQAHAEETQGGGAVFRFGGFFGGGFVDWVGKDANGSLPGDEAVPKPGLSAGLLATLDLSTLLSFGVEPLRLAIQPEFVYSTKGAKVESYGEDTGSSFNLSYWQAGLLVRAEYANSGRVAPYFLLGPELGFLRQAVFERRSLGPISGKDDFKSTDLGLILGLGTLFSFPPWGAVSLELRADLGFVSIDGQGDGDEIRNAALTLLVGYLY